MQLATSLVAGERIWIEEEGTPIQYEIGGFDVHASNTMTVVRVNQHSNSSFGASTQYSGSTLDVLMQEFEAKYSAAHRRVMLEVDIICRTGTSTSATLSRRVFAPSYTEMGFGNNGTIAENAALPWYNSNARRIKSLAGGSAAVWWLRSWNSASNAWLVNTLGTANYNGPSNSYSAVPVHVLKSDIWVSDTTVDGAYTIQYGYDEKIDFDAKLIEMDDRPVAARAEVDCNGILALKLCNNYNDASPTWETATNGQEHEFSNTIKTAEKWAVGIRIEINREADEDLYCYEPVVLIRK
jgi:hypothetical protein